MVAEELFARSAGAAAARWRRAGLDGAHLRHLQALRLERCDREHKDGRPPDDADLVARALALLEGFAAYPVGAYPTVERLHVGCARYFSPQAHSAALTARCVREVKVKNDAYSASVFSRCRAQRSRAYHRADRSGASHAEAVHRAASDRPRNTGPAAPAHHGLRQR